MTRPRRSTGRKSRRDCLRGLLAAGIAGAATPRTAAAAAGAAAARSRLPALRRGLNLSHWFEYEQGQPVPASELAGLRWTGFDHVRLPVDPVVCGWDPDAASAQLAALPALRAAIEAALGAGLQVVLDLHATPAVKARLEASAPHEAALVQLWSFIARALADLPSSQLAFELYNEPQYYGELAGRWPAQQRRLLAALREHAPNHLALLSGNEGGSFKGLQALPPVADAAVACVFHYYEPFLFTHQGAAWLDTRYTTAGLRNGLRYPAAAQQGVVPGLRQPHPRAARELAEYDAAQWGAARVRADFDAAGAFARQRGLRVLCNEFGVIRAGVDPASRYRWLADVRAAAEANGLGWTLWDYTDIFGVTAQSALPWTGGPRSLDAAALQALALPRAAAPR